MKEIIQVIKKQDDLLQDLVKLSDNQNKRMDSMQGQIDMLTKIVTSQTNSLTRLVDTLTKAL